MPRDCENVYILLTPGHALLGNIFLLPGLCFRGSGVLGQAKKVYLSVWQRTSCAVREGESSSHKRVIRGKRKPVDAVANFVRETRFEARNS